MSPVARYNFPMKKIALLSVLALLAGACANKEPAAPPIHAAALATPAPVTPPKSKPLADGAYRAELSLAQPAPGRVSKTALVKFVIRIRNTGTGIFPSKPSTGELRDAVRLSYHILKAEDRSLLIFDGLRALLPADLPAGTAVDLPIGVKMPGAAGNYLLVFDLVHEDISWFEARKNPPLSVVVKVV